MINGLPLRLRTIREKYNLSQRDIANILDVSPSLISSYETGERTPSVDVLLRLSNAYKCSIDYLLGKTTGNNCFTLSLDGLTASQTQIISQLIDEFQKYNHENIKKQEI